MVSKLQHSLSDELTHAATVLGSWGSLDGAIPRDEIVQGFKDKNKQKKKKQKIVPVEDNDIEVIDLENDETDL